MKLWRASVSDRIGQHGVDVWFFDGTRLEIDGEDLVRSGTSLFRHDESWFESRDAARAHAADKLRELAGVLLAQSYRLTQEETNGPA